VEQADLTVHERDSNSCVAGSHGRNRAALQIAVLVGPELAVHIIFVKEDVTVKRARIQRVRGRRVANKQR
jgi:hypothetical protein